MRARRLGWWIDAASLAAGWRGRGVAWLDGDAAGKQGRWSFVGCEPVEVRQAYWGDPAPFAQVRDLGDAARDADHPLAPRTPEWIGFVAYDAAWSAAAAFGLREGPRMARAGTAPVLRFARYDAVVALDAGARQAWLVGDDDAALDRLQKRLGALAPAPPRARAGAVSPEDPELHRRAIARALEAIAEGEIYQVNLARRWEVPLQGDPIALFLAMRDASPVPFGAYLEAGGMTLLARTMERFLRYDARDRTLETRPIKGTIARSGRDDRREAALLRSDAKERAEHAMIVDLMRNDLGRIAEIGSVRVVDAMRVEPYAGLSHLVSTVRARARPDIDPAAMLEATFPPGSVTGAPKLRAMEIIEALERHPRGPYCGAIGYVDRAGGLSLAVAIRTAIVEGGRAAYFAGGGLVAASDPARELAETDLKARVFLDAIAALQRRQGRRRVSATPEAEAPDARAAAEVRRATTPARSSGVVQRQDSGLWIRE